LLPTDCDDADPCTSNNCNVGVCEYLPVGTVAANLEVQAIGTAVSRNVTFVITNCAGGADTRVLPVSFDAAGLGSVNITDVDAGSAWVSVREGHTLRRLAPLSFAACGASVDLTGASVLEAGDFQTGTVSQDNLVEITDFSILASRWNVAIDPTLATGADATGDGLQGTADFTAIQSNFLILGDAADGCPLALSKSPGDRTRLLRGPSEWDRLVRLGATHIRTNHLRIPNASRADLNDDGIVDVEDIRLFARRNALPLDPAFDHKLKMVERAERRALRR